MAARHDFGLVTHISPEAIGQPGQRRFRLRILTADSESASLWLEKEQLTAVGDAVESVLSDEEYRYERLPLDDLEPDPVFPLSPDVDLQVGQLSMGINRETRHIVLMGSEAAPESEAESFTVEFDYRRGHELRRSIREVVSAGRPPCPLCSGPVDPAGHVCARSNGHHPH
ncbi:MAG: DUF3090 family protein [Chloroflexi bacterium]|nr:DUF3090 family protein [Chloroflexota bacterium]